MATPAWSAQDRARLVQVRLPARAAAMDRKAQHLPPNYEIYGAGDAFEQVGALDAFGPPSR